MSKVEHKIEGFGRPTADDFFAMTQHSMGHREVEDPWEIHFLGFADPAVWRNTRQLEVK